MLASFTACSRILLPVFTGQRAPHCDRCRVEQRVLENSGKFQSCQGPQTAPGEGFPSPALRGNAGGRGGGGCWGRRLLGVRPYEACISGITPDFETPNTFPGPKSKIKATGRNPPPATRPAVAGRLPQTRMVCSLYRGFRIQDRKYLKKIRLCLYRCVPGN